LAVYIRTAGPATGVAQSFRELAGAVAPRVPIVELGSLGELNERSYSQQLWLARAAAVLGAIGLVLATAGLYGVSSYVVAMRSREIAIRIAIGAHPRAILKMMLAQSMRTAGIGLIAGAAAALVASRVIQSEYHGIHDLDPVAFAGSAGLFLAAMLAAAAAPAVRASRVDPVENLKDV
jgi:ABC-type antimicrobial peptide transport system permease subunit